ncbi:TPA: hypothetical protein RJD49_000999 [Legionella pneumophila]|nr:hypothetical protein [Legionella pneumophila]HDV5805143.1 hypothetical protein [Legionella pneumophila]
MDEQNLKQGKTTALKEHNPSWSESLSQSYQLWNDWFSYSIDFGQRSILFFNTLRQCANHMMTHEQQGIAAMCIGGGEATILAIEMVD